MPRRVRELIKDLTVAGFVLLLWRGKGDHRLYRHPTTPGATVNLDGKSGDDAHPYQEQDVREKIQKVREAGQ